MKQTLIITGADGGLGKALLAEASNAGFHIFAVVRKSFDAPASVHVIEADVSNAEEADRAISSVVSEIDKDQFPILLNIAGHYTDMPINRTEQKDIRASFEANVLTVFNTTKAFVEKFDHGGAMIITGQNAHEATNNSSAYASMKLASERLLDSFRAEYQDKGFCFTTFVSGSINTWSEEKEDDAADRNEIAKFILSLFSGNTFWPERVVVRPR